MHSLRYIEDTYEAGTIHPYYDAMRFNFDSTQWDSMQYNAIKENIAFIYLVQTDSKS